MSVPVGSPFNQPLYGANKNMEPLYYRDDKGICVFDENISLFCLETVRNNRPLNGTEPAIIAWPLTKEHVVTLVEFANKHDLCVSVAGTGHDFLTRQMSVGCKDGLFIRTSFMKDMEFDDKVNTVKMGPGIVFAELHEAASNHSRYVASGWATTVGVIGWSIGGGHGPLAGTAGLGVDNIVEVELVTAKGKVLVANSVNNTDLFWALRGGGGSVWGVITSITLKTHPNPEGGFVICSAIWGGEICGEEGITNMTKALDGYLEWT